jgi:hypothetical protein
MLSRWRCLWPVVLFSACAPAEGDWYAERVGSSSAALDAPTPLADHPTLGSYSNDFSDRYLLHFAKDDVELTVFANLETLGLHVARAGLDPAEIAAQCRAQGATSWRQAPAFHRVANGADDLAATSVFGLEPGTPHECTVTVSGTQFEIELTTQPDELDFVPARTVFVDGAASPGGDGTTASPFATIQAAVDQAQPGDEIRVAAGAYHDPVDITASGAPDAWIRLIADGDVILDGSDPSFHLEEEAGWGPWTDYPVCNLPIDGSKLWKLDLSGHPILGTTAFYSIIRDAHALFNFETHEFSSDAENVRVSKLNIALGIRCRGGQASCYPREEGFYFDDTDDVLYLRSDQHPSNYTFKVPVWGSRIRLNGHDWIWVEGFHFLDSRGASSRGGGGIYLDGGASHVVVKDNRFTNAGEAIRLQTPDPSASNVMTEGGAFNRIEYNTITYPHVGQLPYVHTKNNRMRGHSIWLEGAMMNVVRGNVIDDAFLGIAGYRETTTYDPFITNYQYEADVYDNVINRISSARLAFQRQWVNARVFRNVMQDGHVGYAMVHAKAGPIWYVRNVLHNADGQVFKCVYGGQPESEPTAATLFYHNDFIRTRQQWPYLCTGGGTSETLTPDKYCARSSFDWTPQWISGGSTPDCYYAHYLLGSAGEFSLTVPSFQFRNNLFVATENAAATGDVPPMDLDFDAYWRLGSDEWFPGIARFGGTAYYDVGALFADVGVEEQGLFADPGFAAPLIDTAYDEIAGLDYRLRPDSELVDRGLLLDGINDDFSDGAPDIGARELDCGEPSPRACYAGPTGTEGVGRCVAGSQTCTLGVWNGCEGEVLPDVEDCGDGIDNDCDGFVDVADAADCGGDEPGPGELAGSEQGDGGCGCRTARPRSPVWRGWSGLLLLLLLRRRRWRQITRFGSDRSARGSPRLGRSRWSSGR